MLVLRTHGVLLIAVALLPLSAQLFAMLIPRARGWGLLDRPGGRHLHAMPVVIVGGICVIATWFAGIGALAALSPLWMRANIQELGVIAGCVALILALGLADDSRGVSPKTRLLVELAVAALSVAFVPSAREFCEDLQPVLGPIVYLLVGIGIVAVMNAMNLVDGMDGLAGSMLLAIAASVVVLTFPLTEDSAIGGIIALFLIPGLLAFLRKNWNPAVTFLGDHGSLSVGYLLVIAALNVRSQGHVHGLADICLLAALFSYPVLDMFICMVKRWGQGQPISTGDRNHMHHRMLRLGLSVRESVVGLLVWQVAMLTPAFMIRVLPGSWAPLILLPAIAVAAERLVFLGRIEGARLRQLRGRVGFGRPRAVPPAGAAFVRARVCISLKPILEASQYEERGCLEQMVEALVFFCERKAKGHGFVQLTEEEVRVNLLGEKTGSGTFPDPDQLLSDWAEALRGFSQAFRLTYSTWELPIRVQTQVEPDDASQKQGHQREKKGVSRAA